MAEHKTIQEVKIFLLLVFSLVYMIIFMPLAKEKSIALAIFPAIIMTFAFGFLPLLPNSTLTRRWYDPSTLFNLAAMYYCIKGISISYGLIPPYLALFTNHEITNSLYKILFVVTLAILLFNLMYIWVTRRLKINHRLIAKRRISRNVLIITTFVCTIIGISSFIILFQSLNVSVLYFLENPLARSYIATDIFKYHSPFANLWRIGISFFSIGSIIWLVDIGLRKKKPHVLWFLHAILGISALSLTGGRIDVLGTVVSLLVIYHLFVKPINILQMASIGTFGLVYAYAVRSWRSIVGMGGIEQAKSINAILGNLSIRELVNFLSGVDLSDIRVLILLRNFYGKSVLLRHGSTYLRLFTQLIPRAIWPSKPMDLALEVSSLYLGKGTLTGIPPGFWGELYMNFHFIVMVLGSALLGFLLAKVYIYLMGKVSIEKKIYYALLVPTILILPSATFSNAILTFIIKFIGLVIVFKFAQLVTRTKLSSSRQYRLL